jgi:hypothetical protein
MVVAALHAGALDMSKGPVDTNHTRATEKGEMAMKGYPRSATLAGWVLAAAASIGSHADAARAVNSCKGTAERGLRSCKASAQGEKWLASGKCANLADPHAKATCTQQAKADATDALASCKEQDGLRQAACKRLGPAPYAPVIIPANFTHSTTIDNPYFALPPGMTFVYEGTVTEEPAGFQHEEFIVTHTTREIQGITCVEVHDKVFLNGLLQEDTRDWFAQDNAGTVWYFGENTTLLDEHGLPVDLSGSWMAGVDGAQPGIIMEATSVVGDFYRQEFLLGEAEDLAEVSSLTETVTVPFPPGTFDNCLKITESAPISPGDVSPKFYFAGVGNLLTVEANGDRSELVRIEPNME